MNKMVTQTPNNSSLPQFKRMPLLVGNWKMFGNLSSIQELLPFISSQIDPNAKSEVVICPPFVYLPIVQQYLNNKILLGAQNCYFEQSGPFTGEISSSMLSNLGVNFVILGHSERRQLFNETDALIARKCQAAYDNGLVPIVCFGESLEQRKAGKTYSFIGHQLEQILHNVSKSVLDRLVLAYEPIWAIGTGITASPDEAEEAHLFLRSVIQKFYPEVEKTIRILYGGSVKPENASALFAKANIDGALVGGASLVGPEFLAIYKQLELHKTV